MSEMMAVSNWWIREKPLTEIYDLPLTVER